MNIRPLGDRVLVEPVEEKEQMIGGIYIPDAAKEKPIKGTVKALGKKYDKDHKELAFDVKVGDEVLLPQNVLNRILVLRNQLTDMTPIEAMEFLQKNMRNTHTNEEFLFTMDK